MGGGGASLFSHQSLLRERGDPVSSQGNLPRECGLGKEPFFSTVLTLLEQSATPSPNLPPPPSLSPAFPTPATPLILLNSSRRHPCSGSPHVFSSCRTPHCSALTSSINPHRPLHSTSFPLLIPPHPSFGPAPFHPYHTFCYHSASHLPLLVVCASAFLHHSPACTSPALLSLHSCFRFGGPEISFSPPVFAG